MTTDTTCRRCGAAIGADVEYCPLCGLAVSGDGEIAPTATAETLAETPGFRSTLEEQMLIALRDATLGEYEILSELGRGGMATVYLAHEIALNRKVAIKVISPHLLADNTAERFLREARTAAGLSHPNLIPIFSVRETDSILFFVMKFVAGPTVESLIKDGHTLSIPVVQAILSETAAALGYAHRRGIVHRDVKPGNIMLDEEGRVVVTDFGIARNSESTGLTGTGMSVGTPMYMSPEQCLGDPVSGASDQYSLGIVGYQMLAGKVPFDAANAVAMMYAHMHTPPRPLLEVRPDCPPALAAAIMRMIEKIATDRWPTIEEANRALGALPLTDDDPARKTLMEFARIGAAEKRLSLPSTPQSPMPATRATPRRAPRPMATPARGVAASGDPVVAGAPTVRITPLESQAAAGTPAGAVQGKKSWRMAIGVSAIAVLAVIAWVVIAPRRFADPGPVRATAVAPSTASDVTPAPGAGGPAAAQPAAPPSAPVAAPATGTGVPHVATIAIAPPVSELKIGEMLHLRALPRDSAGRVLSERGVRWTTSDERIATISAGGLVAGVAEGRVTVTATLDGRSIALPVTVVPAPIATPTTVPVASIDITPAALTLEPSATGQLRAIARDAAGNSLTDRPIQWGSANPRVADVSTNGLVIAVSPGSTQVIAATEGQRTSVPVNVTAAVAAAPPPAPPPDPVPGIRKLIDAWVAAIRSRDVTRLIALYPALSSKTRSDWDNLFDDYPEVTATLLPESVDIAADGATARFDLAVTLTNGRERQNILMHFLTNPETSSGAWHFRQVVQGFTRK